MHAGTGYTVRYRASSGATFVLNTTSGCQQEAEQACTMGGGHLAAFTTWQEQNETERYLIDNVSGAGLGRAGLSCHAAVH